MFLLGYVLYLAAFTLIIGEALKRFLYPNKASVRIDYVKQTENK